MDLPVWLLTCPPMPRDLATGAAFDSLLDRALEEGPGQPIDYRLAAPKWQFLTHVAERRGIVLHGSGNPNIARLEPRQTDDVDPFGNQAAVYAASEGIWPIFFAILDREHFATGLLVNGCMYIAGESDPYYFFSISQAALDQRPWREGTVYLLPASDFERQPSLSLGDVRVSSGQVASGRPVVPVAKLRVAPGDFPFLERVRGHNDVATIARARANPDGFPWLDPE